MAELDPTLTNEIAMSPQGGGAGTENACYALTLGAGKFMCMLASGDAAAGMAGIILGWRMNIDPADGTPWCPKGVIPLSKTVELQQ